MRQSLESLMGSGKLNEIMSCCYEANLKTKIAIIFSRASTNLRNIQIRRIAFDEDCLNDIEQNTNLRNIQISWQEEAGKADVADRPVQSSVCIVIIIITNSSSIIIIIIRNSINSSSIISIIIGGSIFIININDGWKP